MISNIAFTTRALTATGILLMTGPAQAALLYGASLKNGDYGDGFIVDTFTSCSDRSGATCGDGDLSNIGITDTPNGVDYTSNNAVINYSIGRDYGAATQTSFRTHGTVAVKFRASLEDHVSGQPFTDNYGFNRFRGGQGTFGVGMNRDKGADGIAGTADDEVTIGWSTWHSNVWYGHESARTSYDRWHSLGLAWGGPDNDFEIWLDGELASFDNLPTGVVQEWGSSGLGSAYNFALGEIHERPSGNSTTYGVSFADLEIWDEYRALGATSPVPLPASLPLLGSALALTGLFGYRRR